MRRRVALDARAPSLLQRGPMRPVLIASEIYRQPAFGTRHPLAIPRVGAALDLIRALTALEPGQCRDSPRATMAELARWHDPAYLEVLARGERDPSSVTEAERRRYHVGIDGNPIHDRMLSRPATACGGTLLAARLLAEPGLVWNLGGGTHHGRPDRAAGFCYLNDIVLGILALLDQGLARILYVDLDAHHGDGVQDALSRDPRLLIVSVHEAGRWPFTGAAEDRGGGSARNLPVPEGFNDAELDHLVEAALLPLAERFRPEALVLQCGVDALAEDPLSRLALSNGALWRAAARLARMAPRVLVLGGGGYNPWSVARAWAGLWLVLGGRPVPARLPPAAEAVLRGLEWRHSRGRNPPDSWFTTLADPPRPGPVRDAVRAVAAAALA